jgi:hypothetical protein
MLANCRRQVRLNSSADVARLPRRPAAISPELEMTIGLL